MVVPNESYYNSNFIEFETFTINQQNYTYNKIVKLQISKNPNNSLPKSNEVVPNESYYNFKCINFSN